MAAHLGHRGAGGIEISADEVAPLLGIELRGNASRANEVTEHHRDIAALAGGFACGRLNHSSGLRWNGMCALSRGRRFGRLPSVERDDSFQDFAAMAE